ncbi:MAG: dienelactone hydrolase family protein [Polyangiaceae bacterium]|nr:dienelactone hydrolase family protein [Polyangiaceae bacterium]
MSDLLRYLAEEIATDFADGFLTRREALRRLALLGVGSTAAVSLLAACSSEPSGAGSATPTASGGQTSSTATATSTATASGTASATASAAQAPAPPAPLPAGVEEIELPGPDGRKLRGTFAAAKQPRGAVLVIHENKGLTDHFRAFPARFAKENYSALAIDLLSEEGGTASLGDPGAATAALGKAPPERHVADLRAGLDELTKRAPKAKLGVIGFCFGGGMTWRVIASKDPRVAAAAPFYGPLPDGADFTGSKAAVLAVYAELDARVNASREAAEAALEKAKLVHEVVTFAGADHAFFNDTGQRYNADAAGKAWTKVLEWFGKHLG